MGMAFVLDWLRLLAFIPLGPQRLLCGCPVQKALYLMAVNDLIEQTKDRGPHHVGATDELRCVPLDDSLHLSSFS